MQVSTVNKVRRTQNSEKEVDVLQALAISEYPALGNAMGESSRTKMYSVFRSGVYRKLKNRAKSKSCCGGLPKITEVRKLKEIIDMGGV